MIKRKHKTTHSLGRYELKMLIAGLAEKGQVINADPANFEHFCDSLSDETKNGRYTFYVNRAVVDIVVTYWHHDRDHSVGVSIYCPKKQESRLENTIQKIMGKGHHLDFSENSDQEIKLPDYPKIDIGALTIRVLSQKDFQKTLKKY